MNKLKVLELFSGIRATSEALNNLNVPHETFSVEFNPKVQEVANILHNTNDPIRDITKFDIEWLPKHWNKQADLVVAGFPCQPFSMAGKGQGFNDEKGRGKLYQDTLKVIKETNPNYVILENVKAITFQKHKWIIEEIENALKEWGYNVHTQIINAKNYLPQNRERVFVMGSKIREVKPIPESSHNYILKDFLEKEQEISQEYFLTKEQLENLKIDIDKLKIEDAKKIIKVGNCSKNDHNGLNVYSVKGLMPTFRENHGASIKIIYSNLSYYSSEKLEKIFNWASHERPLAKIAHKFTSNTKTLTTRTVPTASSQQMVSENIPYGVVKEYENYIYIPDKKEANGNFNRYWKDSKITATITTQNPVKIVNWDEIEKYLLENRTNIKELFYNTFNAENYITGVGTERERERERGPHNRNSHRLRSKFKTKNIWEFSTIKDKINHTKRSLKINGLNWR